MEQGKIIKALREETGLNRKEFAEKFEIPIRTVEDWEASKRNPPLYVSRLLAYRIGIGKSIEQWKRGDGGGYSCKQEKNILVTTDERGEKLVVIPRIIFPGKRNIAWDEVEKYLLKYVGSVVEAAEEKDIIYIGRDFPDEFSSSVYTRKLVGPVARAKANMVQGIPELIEIGTKRRWRN